jgi:hypothetical protein
MARLLDERPSARARLRAALGEPLAGRLVAALARDGERAPREDGAA